MEATEATEATEAEAAEAEAETTRAAAVAARSPGNEGRRTLRLPLARTWEPRSHRAVAKAKGRGLPRVRKQGPEAASALQPSRILELLHAHVILSRLCRIIRKCPSGLGFPVLHLRGWLGNALMRGCLLHPCPPLALLGTVTDVLCTRVYCTSVQYVGRLSHVSGLARGVYAPLPLAVPAVYSNRYKFVDCVVVVCACALLWACRFVCLFVRLSACGSGVR